MFDGVPADQFHQFIAASSRTSLPIHLSFPLHHHHGVSIPSSASAAPAAAPPVITPTTTQAPAPAFLGCFDLYPSSHQILEVVQPHQHHHHGGLHSQLHHQSPPPPAASKNDEGRNLEIEEEGSISAAAIPVDPWSNDEVLALLRIRSSMENWFPEFTWEHISRKLGELGYQRTADKCKEKFEEESRHFNSLSYSKNYRFFSDLDELYHDDNHPQVSNEKNQALGKEKDQQEEEKMDLSQQQEGTENVVTAKPSQENAELVKESMRCKKRKRKYEFEMFKGFCEAVVKKIVAQQEDLHNKLIEDMLRRDAECIAREEAWKCQEMDRVNKEIEMRAQEQIIATDRQAKIIDLLKKFTSGSHADQDIMRKIEDFWKVTKSSSSVTSSSEILPRNPIETASSMSNISHQNPTLPLSSSRETTPSPENHQHISLVTDSCTPRATSSSALAIASQSAHKNAHAKHANPISSAPSFAPKSSQKAGYTPNDQKGEKVAGKRWPRDEVQALINLKCRHTNNFGDDHKEGAKGPLWERISQAMLELGYKRSAKRCKEKWENINKYFRKTKDSNKKRSLESRTCPYFHQLSTLYNQGKLVALSDDVPENCPSPNTGTVQDNGGETTS